MTGADHAFQGGERFCSPSRAVDAAVVAGSHHAADVTFAQIVVGWNLGMFQKREQLKPVTHQTLIDPIAVRLGWLLPDESVQSIFKLRTGGRVGFRNERSYCTMSSLRNFNLGSNHETTLVGEIPKPFPWLTS